MITYVVVSLLIVNLTLAIGYVKIANFYQQSATTTPILQSFGKDERDLFILLVDKNGSEVRMPLGNVGYYQTSPLWTKLNETIYYGRLSFFVWNSANQEIEHDILRFEDNVTVRSDHRSLMTVVRNSNTFSGYICNMGKPYGGKKMSVSLCLHNVEEQGVNATQISVLARHSNCRGCPMSQIKPRKRESSLEFTMPDVQSNTWNLTVEYKNINDQHVKICQLVNVRLTAGNLHMVVVKPNTTSHSRTMFDCVMFTDKIYYESLGMWVPIISGLTCLIFISMTAVIIYKKCDRSCIRQLLPTPDQDTAPYRSFNSSNSSESPPALRCTSPHENSDATTGRYIKMKSLSGSKKRGAGEGESCESSGTMTSHIPSFLSRNKEPQYARI